MNIVQRSIGERKIDLVYLTFFIIHIPIMLLVDITPLYPEFVKPAFLSRIRHFYITEYKDRFFSESAPSWFTVYILMEAVYHLPLSCWAVGAILRDDPLVPLHLVIWATQTVVSTATCLVEMSSWDDLLPAEKVKLSWLYGPYLALAIFMGVDMFRRLRGKLTTAEEGTKKVV